ncbi:MAG TPA: hypothetical protein VKT73_13735 [Xanthobacteraceae bacterium]|nr:hypothetical protein [Xanthobacteraceae bacterium]
MAYWFRPKRYGYGATPVTWQGWAVTVIAAAFVALCVLNLTLGEQSLWRWIATVVLLVLVTLATVYVCRLKTDGEWAWRWGGRK